MAQGVYGRKANRIAVRHRLGREVAVIEIVSPGNKDRQHAVRSFVATAEEFLRHGVDLLLVDPFPPTPPRPERTALAHPGRADRRAVRPPAGGQAARRQRVRRRARPRPDVGPRAAGDPQPDLPLSLELGVSMPCPLDAAYANSWAAMPGVIREVVPPLAD